MLKDDYGAFAPYYDRLGWNLFAGECAIRLKSFVRLRGTGAERVLDLACGTGELEYRLRRTKLKFTGIDISARMLLVARGKNPRANFVRADIASFRLKETFDIAVCFFDSINHLPGLPAIKNTFGNVRNHLRPGGFFIFDMLTPDGLIQWEFFDFKKRKAYTVITSGVYHEKTMTADISIEGFVRTKGAFYKGFRQKITERTYPFVTIARALTLAGFKNIAVTAFDSEQPIEKCSRWFIVAS